MVDQERIRQQAKRIMDDFMLALDKVRDIDERFGIERSEEVRIPKAQKKNPEFRELMLRNAPKVKDDCILAEKKKW